jgi:putative transposase
MSRKRYTPEKIIGMLRQTEVELARGKRIGEVCRSRGSRNRVTIAGAASTVD